MQFQYICYVTTLSIENMVKTKTELYDYIKADFNRYGKRKPRFLGYFYGDETYSTLKFLKRLRLTEYYKNTLKKNNPFLLVRFIWSFFLYRRMWDKYKLHVPLNVVGPGLYIPHRAGGVYINAKEVGCNFTISSGCVLGAKGDKDNIPSIGDNVECCIGAKIIGKIFVGNNTIIAPNSVVIKDVPEDDVVSGVPATTIKVREK